MALNTYADVQSFITSVLTTNNEIGGIPFSPHKAFWSTLSYNDFINGNVPGVTDPNTGAQLPILVRGDSSKSNIILALKGAVGSLFDPNTGAIGQMPSNGPPMFSDAQIGLIADWIDRGCPP